MLQFFTLSCGKIKSYQTSVGASVYLLVNYWSLGPVTVKNVAITAEGGDDYQKHNACRRAWAVYFPTTAVGFGTTRSITTHHATRGARRGAFQGLIVGATLSLPVYKLLSNQPPACMTGGLCS